MSFLFLLDLFTYLFIYLFVFLFCLFVCSLVYLFHLDIDECLTGTDNCPSNSICLNTPGSFSCQCITGFKLIGGICVGMRFSRLF